MNVKSIFFQVIEWAENHKTEKSPKVIETDKIYWYPLSPFNQNFIDTGSYALNALVSGSLYGGFAGNKITAIAGEQATGKTFFLLGMVKSFLDANPTGGVLYFESESALSKEMVESRGIDSKRMYIMPVTTIQEFRTQALKVIETHLKTPKKDRPPLVMCLDSLGNLSTEKEVNDMKKR